MQSTAAESMIVPKPTAEPRLSATRSFGLHLWAFLLPLLNMSFLLGGPYPWWAAMLWCLPIWLLVAIDSRAKPDLRQPEEGTPTWPFDLQVYALTAIQIANHILIGVMASKLSLASWGDAGTAFANLIATQSVSGVCAGYSGIVLAHELVHRRNRVQFFLGRLLLMFVCYEHFATEHVRGHHPRIGTREDPATARFGETFQHFLWRTVPAQFRSAWHLEQVRLELAGVPFYSPRHLRNRAKGMLGGMTALPGPDWTDTLEHFGPVVGRVTHVFTHFRLELAIVARSEPAGEGWWHPLDRLNQAGLPTLYRRAADAVLAGGAKLAA